MERRLRDEVLKLRSPVGVFDSGVGGLTVLRALREALPGRDFLYLADTARVPYGRKPREMVAAFAREITDFLLGLGARSIVVACNTASACALPELGASARVPVWGVIEPAVAAARQASRTGHVGVIGTSGAIASGVYQRSLEGLGLRVWARACPLFVFLVEEGLAAAPEAELLARHYLADRPDVDTLILGCTHYPVLRDAIARVLGDAVTLVDSAAPTARAVAESAGAEQDAGRPGRVLHLVTGDALAYEHTARAIGVSEGPVLHLDVAALSVVPRSTEPRPSGSGLLP